MLRQPMPGDAVRYVGPDPNGFLHLPPDNEEPELSAFKRIGVIDGMLGRPREQYLVTWKVIGAFRGGEYGEKEKGYVSASGGPACFLRSAELTPTNDTVNYPFWCWKTYRKAHGGEDYRLEVPVWEWRGRDVGVFEE